MKTVRLLATNTLAQLLGKVTTVGSTILIGRMISSPNGLGKSGFDEYAIIVTYAAYFYIITDFGFNAIAAKDITQDESKTSSYLSNLLTLRIGLAVGLMMLGLATLAFISEYTTTIKLGILFMLVTILSQAIFTNGNILFQAKLRYFQSTLAIVTGSAISLSLAFIVFKSGGNLFGYLGALIAGSFIMALISFIQVRSEVPLSLRYDKSVWRHVIFAALPLGATIVFNLLYVRSGFFILSIFDKEFYGIYTMAYRVFDAVLVIPVFIVNAIYPILIQRLQTSMEEFKKLFYKALLGMLGLSLIAMALVWILAPLAIWLSTDNPNFNESIQALRWLSLLVPLFFVSNILLWTLITLERRKILILFYGIGAIISIGMNLWLIPEHGYPAAIAITGLVEALIGIFMAVHIWILFRREDNLTSKTDGTLSEMEVNAYKDEEVALHE